MRLAWTIRLPQHPDKHRPQRPIFFAIDQQLGEEESHSRGQPSSPDRDER